MKEGTCCTQALSRLCLRTQISPSYACCKKEGILGRLSDEGVSRFPPRPRLHFQSRRLNAAASTACIAPLILTPSHSRAITERDWRKSARPSSLVGCVIHAIHIHYGHAHHAHARRVLARARRQRRRTNESIFAMTTSATATTVAHAQRS